jgi:hypothetical protein
MAMTREQQQALSGGVDSSFEEKLKELAEIKLKIAAEEARVKAELAEAKAVEASASEPTEVQQQALSGMGLTGNRDVDGSLMEELDVVAEEVNQIPVAPDKGIEVSKDSHREDFKEAAARQQSERGIQTEKFEDELEELNSNYGVKENAQKELGITHKYLNYLKDETALVIKHTAANQTIADKQDIDEDFTTDEESAQKEMGSNVEQDRAQSDWKDEEVRGEKAGWTMAEGSNMWSVDEKDDYWKTQEGYDEAVALYGKKPAWVKEPTLVWNSETQEYEEVEEEEFEDLSQPTISADIKKLFG